MLRGSYYVAAREDYKTTANNYLKCQVKLLDDNVEYFTLQVNFCPATYKCFNNKFYFTNLEKSLWSVSFGLSF